MTTRAPGGARVPGVRRMAVLRAGAIGDFLVAVPALAALRRCYPGADIVVLGDAWLPELLRGRPGPWDDAVVAPLYPGLRGVPTDAEPGEDTQEFFAAHAGGYDLALQMHGGGRNSNPFVRRLRPRVSAGARAGDAEPLDRWIPYVAQRPETLRWLEVAGLVGAGLRSVEDVTPRLAVTEHDRAESYRLLPREGPFALMHVGARDERRRWPAAKFAAVARELAATHAARVVLVGSAADQRASAAVTALLGPAVTDLTGKASLRGLLGLASRSVLMVGNDSGPRHLAASAGTPTVAVFWVANVLTFGPLVGPSDRAVVSYTVECPVCGGPQLGGQRCGHDVSFVDSVAVDDVLAAVSEVLAPTGQPAPGSAPTAHGSPIR